MSLRYKYADIFWFIFFHEIGHTLLHGKKETYIEFDLDERKEIEDESDDFASETLIPEDKFRNFVHQRKFSQRMIIILFRVPDFSCNINNCDWYGLIYDKTK